MNLSKLRFKAFICNMIVILLCLSSILSYFLFDFWRVELSCNITGEALTKIGGEETESEDDIGKYLGDTEIPVKLSISLKTSYILSSYGSDSEKTVQKIIDDNVNSLVEQIYPSLNVAVKEIAKATTSTILKEQAHTILQDHYGSEKDEEEINRVLNDVGINDAYIDEKTDEIIESFYAEGATKDSVADSIIDVLEDVCDKLEKSEDEELSGIELTEEDKEEIREEIKSTLDEFVGEKDEINMEDVLADLLLKVMDKEKSDSADANEVKPINVRLTSSETETETDSKEELKKKLRDTIVEKIPEDAAATIVKVLQGVGYVIFFTFFTWAYLIIKILAKLNNLNNTIKLKLPIWLGWLPCSILYFSPTLLFSLINNPSLLAKLIPSIGESIMTATAPLRALQFKISFFSCSIISFIIAMVLLVFSIAYYGSIRRQLARMKKEGVQLQKAETVNIPVSAETAATHAIEEKNDKSDNKSNTDNSF